MDARQSLVFHIAPSLFVKKTYTIFRVLERDFNQADAKTKKNFLNFLTKYTIDLTPFLPQ